MLAARSLFITADFCAWARRHGKRDGCCILRARGSDDAAFYRQAINTRERLSLDDPPFHATFAVSRSPRASPETSQSRSGMRRPARVARNHAREASETEPSATMSGREELADGEA